MEGGEDTWALVGGEGAGALVVWEGGSVLQETVEGDGWLGVGGSVEAEPGSVDRAKWRALMESLREERVIAR